MKSPKLINICIPVFMLWDQGASGVDMGRNIFQSDHPVAMMKAVQAVVHHNETCFCSALFIPESRLFKALTFSRKPQESDRKSVV